MVFYFYFSLVVFNKRLNVNNNKYYLILCNMKKIFLLILTMTLFISCQDFKVSGYDFNDCIEKSYNVVKTMSQADSSTIKFCEAQGEFNSKFIKDTCEYTVDRVTSVFQVNDTMVYIITHYDYTKEDAVSVEVYNDIWIGDLYSPYETKINLKDAIKIIRASDIEAPHTEFFVLRRPITKPPFMKNKIYIFGSTNTKPIKVDSETGEISEL